jgi:hypothetical protein
MVEQEEDGLYEIEMGGAAGVGLSYKEIVMGQYKRVVFFFNREFRGGFYMQVPTKLGDEKLIYIEDTRETLSNAILGLAIILKPKFDTHMEQFYQQINLKLKVLKKKFLNDTTLKERTVLGENFYDKQDDKILLHEYKNQKQEIFIKLFARMCLQLQKLKYFQMLGGNF